MSEPNMMGDEPTDSAGTQIDADDEQVDGCVEGIELDEAETTLDVELPPARGGVGRPDLPRP
jgi:hypothetical protein